MSYYKKSVSKDKLLRQENMKKKAHCQNIHAYSLPANKDDDSSCQKSYYGTWNNLALKGKVFLVLWEKKLHCI